MSFLDKSPTIGALGVQICTSFEELSALGPEWHALEAVAEIDLPFQTWEWSISWWSHLRANRHGVRDALRVCVVRTASGELVGVAPLMLTERPGHGPLRVRTLQFIGADPNITELRLMVCHPALERDCYQAVMKHLSACAEQWDWVAWEGLRAESGAVDGMRDQLVHVEQKSAFVLGLPATWDVFKQGLGRNIKQSLRHCYNSLKQDGLTHRLAVLTTPEEIASALPNFFRLHAARANVKGGVAHGDVFLLPQAREFLTDVCMRLAARGAVCLFQLWVDDELVAIRIGFVMSDTLYLYYSGWDPNYGRYSVMTTLLAEAIQYAIGQRLASINLSTGNDVSKTRWGAREVRYCGGRQLSPRRSAHAVHFIYDSASGLRTSRVARALTPAFLVRGSYPGPSPRRRAAHLLEWEDQCRVGSVIAATATVLAVDMFDGILDGTLRLYPWFGG